MSASGSEGFDIKDLVTLLVIGVVAIIGIKLLFFVSGFAIKAFFFVLFTLGPILLVGWLVLKALGFQRGHYVIKVNNRKVLDGVMEAVGITAFCAFSRDD